MKQLVLGYPLPTLNEYIEAERTVLTRTKKGNITLGATFKKKATAKVEHSAIHQIIEPLTGLYDIEINWVRTNNRHDADNVFFAIKFILDGIVKAGKLSGDGRKNIRNIYNNIRTDRDATGHYCTVIFKEIC